MNRAEKRAMLKAQKAAARGRKRHLSGGELIEQKGFGAWMCMLPMSEEEVTRCELPIFLWFKQARTGDLDAKSDIWTNLMSAIAHGWVLAKATTQPVNIERQFSAAAKMLDAAYDHLYKTGEVLQPNFDAVYDALNVLCDIQRQLNRADLLRSLNYVVQNFDAVMRGLFGEQKSVFRGDTK